MKPLTYFRIKLWNSIPESVCPRLLNKYKRNYVDYYKVVIFDSFEKMYEYADKHFQEEEPLERNYSGICKYSSKVIYEDGKLVDIDKCCGWILLHKDYLGGGTVAHECTHAMNYYFKFRITKCEKIFTDHEYDELFAYMLGGLVNQIYNKLYSKKIL